MNNSSLPQRICVIGTSGAGKTTLARQIAQKLNIFHFELDSLFWEPNWVTAPADIFRRRVEEALVGNNWIVDGNYSKTRDIVWGKADTLVWLDYSFPLVMSRVLWRTFHRVTTQQQICNGNYETWGKVFSKESIILWSLQTYRRRKKEYPILIKQPEYSHLNIVRLTSPQAAEDWLSNL
ncbi:AAA family ATPase [Calothrix sp. CCY 0018]|uniref:AAA family ATPase n=1 Tax=Calothrix sp. CCY 0018 TaxID=3103864 RepID=UPI0039C6EA7F